MQTYENFISYRRSESKADALLIYDKLVNERGRSTFLDIRTLGSGIWSDNILEAIAKCTNFIFIRGAQSLDRCRDGDDVVRREIKEAIVRNKNIILVSTCDCEIPNNLPDDINALHTYNELRYAPEYLDAFIDKLVRKFVLSDIDIARSDPEKDFVILDSGVLVQYVGCATIVEIPHGVVEVGPHAFKDQTRIRQVNFPATVRKIGRESFSRCARISSVDLPDGLAEIGERAFARCYGLLNITFPDGLETIGNGAFLFCESLKEVRLGTKVSHVTASAFNHCGQLRWIEVAPDNPVLSSHEGILYDKEGRRMLRCPECYAVDSVDVLPSTKSVEPYGFWGCRRLREIRLPGGIETIGEYAFGECTNVMQMTLPDSVVEFSPLALNGWNANQRVLVGAGGNPKVRKCVEETLREISEHAADDVQEDGFCLVKTMFEHEAEAKEMARGLIDRHLIVSGQIGKAINSLYAWDGKIQDEMEFELTCFTETAKYKAVEKYITEHHSYDVCELICLPILATSDDFGRWISDYVNDGERKG